MPAHFFRRLLACTALVCLLGAFSLSRAAETFPPKPDRYFNDYAHLTRPDTQERLDTQLRDFERATSIQVLVAIFPTLQTDRTIEDYTQRVAESWGVGQRKTDNGAVLFVFAKEHKMYLQVGYGLEGALPDLLAKQIIQNEITPAFRAGNYDEGLTRGVSAILRAAQGEYKGTGKTVGENQGNPKSSGGSVLLIFIVLFILFQFLRGFGARRGTVYGRSGRRVIGGGAPIFFPTFGGFGGGGSGGGGSGSDFSGGGGRFGGGGAGGDW